MATKKVAKKAPAKKKAVAKKATKKVVKKVAKKAPAKKSAKKVAKKSVKKAPAKRSSVSKIEVPPVPVTSSRPAPKAAEIKTATAIPVASQTAKKQGSSNRVVLAVVVGILALGAIVLSKGSSSSSTATPTNSVSPMPSESASATPTESKSSSVSSIAAPLGIVAHYTAEGATIFWNASTAADGLKGYSVEFRANGGTWSEVATVGADVTKYDITKSDTNGWTSFKISAIYNDGQKAEGKVFGLPGQYK